MNEIVGSNDMPTDDERIELLLAQRIYNEAKVNPPIMSSDAATQELQNLEEAIQQGKANLALARVQLDTLRLKCEASAMHDTKKISEDSMGAMKRGAITGGTIGLFGGPIGAAIGGTIGGVIGMLSKSDMSSSDHWHQTGRDQADIKWKPVVERLEACYNWLNLLEKKIK